MGTANLGNGNDRFQAHTEKYKTGPWWNRKTRYKWNSWTIYGNGGTDNLTGGPKADTIYGDYKWSGNNDWTYNLGSKDQIYGGSGDDSIYAGGGDDYVRGGYNNDVILGQGGHDELYGDSGHDRIFGGTGNDHLFGGSGNDYLRGNSGRNYLKGGANADTFVVGDGFAIIADYAYEEGDKIEFLNGHSNYDVKWNRNLSRYGGSSSIDDIAIFYKGTNNLAAVILDPQDGQRYKYI